ncbi:MAG: caspase family protein [Bacteroidota bacterium]
MHLEQKQSYAYAYQTPAAQTETPQRSINQFATRTGKNYILLIGVNQYENWTPLHNAVKDCEDIAETLTTYYNFEAQNVIRLFNEEATRENILETFESLQESLKAEDNLLIYYAGHGYYDQPSALGYWVPVNARLNKIPDFIRNSTIHDYLRTINTKHTLLIADACYAGSLFATYRGESFSENAKSRWAFTSGNIEKVWDGQPGQNSPFARYLIRYLRNNTREVLPANEIIESVGAVVERNTAQSPKGSSLSGVGDEGGVMVLRRRQSW